MKTFAYIRVSSKDQNEARQLIEMQELGINERDIFIDKDSGKDFNRPQYQALKQCLREGDLLIIKSIDRFGRNSSDIKKEWDFITNEIKADIKVIDMPLLDTTQHKDKLGTFVSDLVLQVLSFVADTERENIKKRQAEGIAVAKADGKHLGRPKMELNALSKEQNGILKGNYEKWKSKEITGVEFMEMLELKKNSFYKIMKEYEATL
ncbi:TPA: recombinase family protein [Bacillus cereus]|nr:recombinase family protein [Bacillus cereus]HDR4623457.1 recombinase family protein [Bacillus cereus]